eukprot:scaffold11739_cov129-Isochrysis_galbana.AAC.2
MPQSCAESLPASPSADAVADPAFRGCVPSPAGDPPAVSALSVPWSALAGTPAGPHPRSTWTARSGRRRDAVDGSGRSPRGYAHGQGEGRGRGNRDGHTVIKGIGAAHRNGHSGCDAGSDGGVLARVRLAAARTVCRTNDAARQRERGRHQ